MPSLLLYISWLWRKISNTSLAGPTSLQKLHCRLIGCLIKLKTYPFFDTRLKKMAMFKGIETINLLNYLPYNKQQVKSTITQELGWKDYGGKHYESIFTRFYQGYILTKKFHIDKRKAHLSNLVFSGQVSKQDALEQLQSPIYDKEQLATDYEFVLKKFSLTHE